MSDDYGSNFITLSDEDGNEFDLEHLDTIEYKGKLYMAFFPLMESEDGEIPDEDSDEYGLILLRLDEIDGEEMLSTIDDEEELNEVYDVFMEELFDDDDEEDEDEDDEED